MSSDESSIDAIALLQYRLSIYIYIYIYRGSREETCNNESGVIWRDVKVVDRSFGPTSATKRRA